MAQGKLKVKAKAPAKKAAKAKKPAATKRANKPISPKKKKNETAAKIKKIITKNVNQAVEEEIRNAALDGKKNLSSAQKAVAAHNTKKSPKKAAAKKGKAKK